MKKWLIGILVVVIILLVLPLGMGYITENKYKEIIANLPDSPVVKVKLENYHRGWFTSNATLDLTFTAPKEGDEPSKQLHLSDNVHITHGPLLFVKNVKGNRRFYLGRSFLHYRVNKPQINVNVTTLVGLAGGITNHLYAPHIALEGQAKTGKESLRIKDLFLKSKFSADLKRIRGKAGVQQLLIKEDNFLQKAENLKMNFDLNRVPQGLLMGKRNIIINKMTWSVGEKTIAAIEDANISSDSDVKDDRANLTIIGKVKSIQAEGKQYGPGLLDMSLKGVDVDALTNLQDHMKTFAQGRYNKIAMQKYLDAWMDLLTQGMTFSIKQFQLNTPDGEVLAQAKFALPKQELLIKHPLLLLANLKAMVNLTVPKPIANDFMEKVLEEDQTFQKTLKHDTTPQENAKATSEQAKALLEDAVKKGRLDDVGNSYKVAIEYQDGNLKVNGKEVSTPIRQ